MAKKMFRRAGYYLAMLGLASGLFGYSILNKKPTELEKALKKHEVVVINENKDYDLVDRILNPTERVLVYSENGEEKVVTEKGEYKIVTKIAERYDGMRNFVIRANKGNIKKEEIGPLSDLGIKLNIIEKQIEKKYNKSLEDFLEENKNKAYLFVVGDENIMIYKGRPYRIPKKIK